MSPRPQGPQRPLQTRIARLTRVTTLAGDTLFFTMPPCGRQRAAVEFLAKDRVPAFEGDSAWFEVEKLSGQPWPYWRAVRQVEAPESPGGG